VRRVGTIGRGLSRSTTSQEKEQRHEEDRNANGDDRKRPTGNRVVSSMREIDGRIKGNGALKGRHHLEAVSGQEEHQNNEPIQDKPSLHFSNGSPKLFHEKDVSRGSTATLPVLAVPWNWLKWIVQSGLFFITTRMAASQSLDDEYRKFMSELRDNPHLAPSELRPPETAPSDHTTRPARSKEDPVFIELSSPAGDTRAAEGADLEEDDSKIQLQLEENELLFNRWQVRLAEMQELARKASRSIKHRAGSGSETSSEEP
jgi:hypothetical protein